tara:strand:+ start:406 stop:615 length:210 start_codon:yes stop_codon:yes gene_type:complete
MAKKAHWMAVLCFNLAPIFGLLALIDEGFTFKIVEVLFQLYFFSFIWWLAKVVLSGGDFSIYPNRKPMD